jgi:hypothetical protein
LRVSQQLSTHSDEEENKGDAFGNDLSEDKHILLSLSNSNIDMRNNKNKNIDQVSFDEYDRLANDNSNEKYDYIGSMNNEHKRFKGDALLCSNSKYNKIKERNLKQKEQSLEKAEIINSISVDSKNKKYI